MQCNKRFSIAIDIMGGDKAPLMPLEGINIAMTRHPNIDFILFGEFDMIRREYRHIDLEKYNIVHCSKYISSHERPATAFRNSNGTSLRAAVQSVANNHSKAIISAGNTGAFMAISKAIFRTLPCIDRPAFCTLIPTKKSLCLILDVGANISCTADNFLEFAIMGDAFMRATIGKKNSKLAILNIGSEKHKGGTVLQKADDLLSNNALFKNRYCGYIEPHLVFDGDINIVLCDGFSGNIVIKSIEGTMSWIKMMFEDAFRSTWISKIGYLLSHTAIKKNMKAINPRNYNGAMFLGLNSIAIKSHGGTDSIGFAKAIDYTVALVNSGINQRIVDAINKK